MVPGIALVGKHYGNSAQPILEVNKSNEPMFICLLGYVANSDSTLATQEEKPLIGLA